MMDDTYTYRKLTSVPGGRHAHGDKRTPTHYEVTDQYGRVLGTVHSMSSESWRQMRSGIRYGFRGYSRTWEAIAPDGTNCGTHHWTRANAAWALERHHNNRLERG